MIEFVTHNMAPLMFAGLIFGMVIGYPAAFSIAAVGLFFGFVGVELGLIRPDFLDGSGNSRSKDEPLPVGVELPARMFIVVDEMREQVHRARIAPGVRFFCHEGGKRVAEGVVTRVSGLFEPRTAADARPAG